MIISFAILAGMLAASILCAAKMLTADANRLGLLAGTALWFALAPFWMRRER
jgi:hypothetical protein